MFQSYLSSDNSATQSRSAHRFNAFIKPTPTCVKSHSSIPLIQVQTSARLVTNFVTMALKTEGKAQRVIHSFTQLARGTLSKPLRPFTRAKRLKWSDKMFLEVCTSDPPRQCHWLITEAAWSSRVVTEREPSMKCLVGQSNAHGIGVRDSER